VVQVEEVVVIEKNPEVKTEPEIPKGQDLVRDKDENEAPVIADKEYVYTVKYMDIADKTTLYMVTGKGKEDDIIQLNPLDIDGYIICEGQKDSIALTSNHFTVSIYYQKEFRGKKS
jgi:hypothetical protein